MIVAARLEQALMGLQKYTIVSMSSRKSVLEEQSFDQSGLTEGDGALQIGQMVSARKLIEIQQTENAYIARLVVVSTSVLEKSWTESFTPAAMDQQPAQTRLIKKIIADLSGKTMDQISEWVSEASFELLSPQESATISNGFLNADGSYTLVNPRVFYAGEFLPLSASSSYMSEDGICQLFGFSKAVFHEREKTREKTIVIDHHSRFVVVDFNREDLLSVTRITCTQ